MVYIVFAGLLLYIIMLIVLLIGLNNTISADGASTIRIHRISVIIPFRNEAANLPALVACLQRQDYPSFEVIFVDDHSTDGGDVVVGESCHLDKRFRLIRATGHGKKQAITDGISVADGEIIVTTDADCTFLPGWLSEINKPFSDQAVKLVFGPVHMAKGDTLFDSLQQMEFASVMGSGMAMFGIGHPLYCNGANLAYRKEVFERLGGFAGNSHVASGDDQFLLDKVRSEYRNGIFLLHGSNALVTTKPQHSVRSFVHQRLRWAGKWASTMTGVGKGMAIFIFLLQFIVISSWLLVATQKSPSLLVIAGVKVLLEFILISTVLSGAGQKTSFLHFILLQFIYPFYVIAIAMSSNFVSFDWKGRRHPPLQRI